MKISIRLLYDSEPSVSKVNNAELLIEPRVLIIIADDKTAENNLFFIVIPPLFILILQVSSELPQHHQL